jgi:hypothetical protein
MAHSREQRGGPDRRGFLAGVVVGLALAGLCWLGVAQWKRAFAPSPANVQVVSTFPRNEEAGEVTRADPAPGPAPAPAISPETERRTAPADHKVEFPVYEKLASAPLSREPYRLLGAWDEDEQSSAPGLRRAFVLAVAPSQSDASLEALARDVRARNRDALILDVRIYDDPNAATAPRVVDGGRLARAHLVAEIQRNEGAGLDVIRVRGRALEPQ